MMDNLHILFNSHNCYSHNYILTYWLCKRRCMDNLHILCNSVIIRDAIRTTMITFFLKASLERKFHFWLCKKNARCRGLFSCLINFYFLFTICGLKTHLGVAFWTVGTEDSNLRQWTLTEQLHDPCICTSCVTSCSWVHLNLTVRKGASTI